MTEKFSHFLFLKLDYLYFTLIIKSDNKKIAL